MSFRPGPGLGGHCLPVDPFYLAWKAREYDTPTEFIELAGEVNQAMPYFCADKVVRALNDAHKSVRGARVALLGVSYKAGVGDMRESPAIKILRLLADRGAELSYHDSHVAALPEFGLESQPLDEVLAAADAGRPGRRNAVAGLGRRHRTVAISLLVGLLAAVLVAGHVTLLPPHIGARDLQVAGAATSVMIDNPRSATTDRRTDDVGFQS